MLGVTGPRSGRMFQFQLGPGRNKQTETQIWHASVKHFTWPIPLRLAIERWLSHLLCDCTGDRASLWVLQ